MPSRKSQVPSRRAPRSLGVSLPKDIAPSKHLKAHITYTNNQPHRFITSPCTKARAWGAVDRQYIPKGSKAL